MFFVVSGIALAVSCSGNFLDTPLPANVFAPEIRTAPENLCSMKFSEDESIMTSIVFSSCSSWKAVLPSDCGWLRSDIESDLNFSKTPREYTLRLDADENLSGSDRSAVVVINTSEGDLSIPVTQQKCTPTLELISPQELQLPCDGVDVTIDIRCNVDWNALVAGGASASVEFVCASGSRSGAVRLRVNPNLDASRTKTATIIVRAEGCEDLYVSITQAKYTAE